MNTAQPDNSFDPGRERSNSNYDQRQRFAWASSYLIPNGRRLRSLTSGWVVSNVLTVSRGEPFTPNYVFEGDFNGSGEFFGRPDLVGNPFAGTGGPHAILNLSAFQVPCTLDNTGNCIPATQHFGNLGRNTFVGPSLRNIDLSVAKTTALTERLRVELRADAYNFINHVNFANPVTQNFFVDFLQNGMTPQGRGIGFLPLTQTPDVGSQGPFLNGGGPRSMQLSLKFLF